MPELINKRLWNSLRIIIALSILSIITSHEIEYSSSVCSHGQSLCGESLCYDPTTQYCNELGRIISCNDTCGSLCYDPSIQQCFNETICNLNQQLCVIRYDSDGYEYSTPVYRCYNPSYEACLNNYLCNYPTRSCDQRCLLNNQVCVNNITVCNVTKWYYNYEPNQIKLCSGVCYDTVIQQCINDSLQCVDDCFGSCYNSSLQQCLNGTICNLDEQLCVIKSYPPRYQCYNTLSYKCLNGTLCYINQELCTIKYDFYGNEYTTPIYQCYNPSYEACFNNYLCNYPSRSCHQQCLLNTQVCVNNITICNVTTDYYNYEPNQIKLCNSSCYDSSIQQCINNSVECIDICGSQCYNASTKQCLNGTICHFGEELCVVKYDLYGYEHPLPVYSCYNSSIQACLNNSLCNYPSRSCNGQCLLYNQVCANNITICQVTNSYSYYEPDQIKLCNGICYDSIVERCDDGHIECINDCCGTCYNPSLKQCLNGSVCNIGEELCVVKYNSWDGDKYNFPQFQCYNPFYQVCMNNSLCYSDRICRQQCLRSNQICVNNITICNVTTDYYNYEPNQIKLCNGVCYDSVIEQCTNDSIRCISGNCSGLCYDSTAKQCFNGTICDLDEQLCVIKYDYWDGHAYDFPEYVCYDPSYSTCLNNSLCSYPYEVCDHQCLRYTQVCVNNVTICDLTDRYNNFAFDEIKLCNGICYNSTSGQCIDGSIRCISGNCSGSCYNMTSERCLNGTVCDLNEDLCLIKYNIFGGYVYDPPHPYCYDSSEYTCFNNTLCHNQYGTCNQQCLQYNQICVNNDTICNIPDWYDKYEPNQIKLCNGICYHSAIQRCINGILIDCTPSWSFERCEYEAVDCLQYGNTTLLSTLTPPTTKLTSSSFSSSSEIPTTIPSYASSIYIQFNCLHISLIVVVQMLNTNFLF